MTIFFFFILISLVPVSLSSLAPIHSLLRLHGLPAGLLPKQVTSFSHSSSSGLLHVYLDTPCFTKLDTTVAFYDTYVRANLTRQSLSAVEGLSQEELFVWLPVKDIKVDDPLSGIIVIDIGVATKRVAFALFEEPPDCQPGLFGSY